ncbi:MAG: tRNA 5-methoxyuridine(34)/uridine 5-oxyacetic acid(34) synthase CmoB [Mariprofundus sp.]|nr:tRNA 5-methoxyuridine(34)/uridine 5-oxyacetic acid(34) synthase CmoB [Mariprofundus sp.]
MRAFRDLESARLKKRLADTSLAGWSDSLLALHKQGWDNVLEHGDMERWQSSFNALPDVTPSEIRLNAPVVKIGGAADTSIPATVLESALKQMHPWRKGPFELFGIHIDTEWHSDWKWDRLKDAISPLQGRAVLDVGCGSGYHLWRMLGAEAELVIGIDPTALFSMQFAALKRYQPDAAVFFLPIGIETMPAAMGCFDSVFSMGILYHRRSPIGHLIELKELLHCGGELVLDTLVIEGNEQSCLIPHRRYAKMRNVWFIPSVNMLKLWLKRAGFKDIKLVDVSPTSTEEQRSTEWMTFESLADFLDPHDSSRTIEGYPTPVRAILTAKT